MSGFKDYGISVSQNPHDTSAGGQFASEDKSYESLIIQDNIPIIDWEMNLRTDIDNDQGFRLNAQRLLPSCFLDGDFLEHADVTGSYAFLAATVGNENKLRLKACNASINGWNVRVEYSDTTSVGFNDIILTNPPASGTRIDFVILEVWRALVRALPSVDNKSTSGLICRFGNVKAPDGVNLTDDLIDPNFLSESSARVQIQYRLRVIPNVNLASYPDGLDDPSVVANSVSNFSGPGADGTPTLYTYSTVPNDKSLWRAGSGDSTSATALGTVDGYMYSVPVCAVYRRNLSTFQRSSNMNGGSIISSGTPTRPDGLYVDQIVSDDVRDLRKGRAQFLDEILDKAFQQVLDNSLTTQFELSNLGTAGTGFLYKDDIGLGTHAGNPDGVRKYFSDRSITETIVTAVTIGGLPVSSISINLNSLKLPWRVSPVNLVSLSDACIASVNAVRIVDSSGNTDRDMFDNSNPIKINSISYSVFSGPNIDKVDITFNTTTANTVIYVELLIEYPRGVGLTRNIVNDYDVWGPAAGLAAWVDTTAWTTTSDVNRKSLPRDPNWWTNIGHREFALRLITTSQTDTYYTIAIDRLLIRERLTGPITITDGINSPYTTTNYTFNTSMTIVQLTGATPISANTSVSVSYTAYRPAEPTSSPPSDSYNIFYKSRAVQSLRPPSGNQTLNLIPKVISKQLYVLTGGSGCPDDTIPFAMGSAQLAVPSLPTIDFPESVLDGPALLNLNNFSSDTGFVQLPALVPYMPNPAEVTLYRGAPDTVTDAEGRNFWPKSNNGSGVRSPASHAQPLLNGQRHKVALPVLMELKDDFLSIGKKGTLILVVFISWSDFDPANSIELSSSPGNSGASVYRIKGGMINPRRPDY